MREKLAKYNPYLIAALVLVPLIVHLKHIMPPQELAIFPDYRDEFDLFTFCKSRVLIWCGMCCCIFMDPKKVSPLLFWPSFMFFLTLAMGSVFSEYPLISLYGTPNYNEGALCWLSYIAIMFSTTQMTKKSLEYVLTSAAAFVVFFCIVQSVAGNFLMLSWIHPLVGAGEINATARPIYGTLMNPNHLGLFSALLLPYFIASPSGSLSSVMLYPMIWSGLSSASRGFLISTLVSIAFVGKHKGIGWKTAVAFIIFAGAVILFYQPWYHSEISNRLFIYKKSLPLLLDTFALGKGMATFLLYFPQGDPSGFAKNFIVDRPHNFYIQLWHGAGFFGLLSMLLIIFFSWQRGALRERAAILGYMVAGFFTDSMVGVSPLFFAILGSCWIKEEV